MLYVIIIVQKAHTTPISVPRKEEKGGHHFLSISVGRAHYHRQLVKLIELRAEYSAALRYDHCMLSAQSIVEGSIILTVITCPLSPLFVISNSLLALIFVNIYISASQLEKVGDQKPFRTPFRPSL
jgi:hypothetical protein